MVVLAKLGAPSMPVSESSQFATAFLRLGIVIIRLREVPALFKEVLRKNNKIEEKKRIFRFRFYDGQKETDVDPFNYHWHHLLQALPDNPISVPALRGKDYGKTKMRYPDYTETESGLQYKTIAFNIVMTKIQDLRVGDGPSPKKGEIVVVDWDGYTIGYYGRIFEARNKTKGGSFEGGDKDFFKFKVGSGQVIPAFEEAISGMAPGGVRRIIVPPDLGYPDNDYNKLGPKPTTFSVKHLPDFKSYPCQGQRALDFVLRNQGLIDKTLLFDIELLKIIPNQ
ncbi:putative FKBP-like peptidyl-prolyl cis-trans isomerase family protein [Panicum miliaceum]|uniref:peptidylprolyl isomerase n=1 Tax=Panicum miliaceum TaxID=4540 RepID=A0A3L6Q249_PANMI|nr:putative FKBP-like peptidyl-prolyl cis-trans isomerase family protein [Panicum miliaceum]